MLSSINPLGERARGQSFWVTVSWYVTGSVLGGLALGAIGGTVGSLLPAGDWRLAGVILACLAGAALDFSGRRPPSIHRQVDENWLGKYRGWVYGLGFGLQLGLGVVTIVTTASVYTVVAVSVLIGSPGFGALIGGIFGLARSLVIVRVARVRDPGSLRRMMRRLQDGLPMASGLVIGAQLLVVLIAAWALM
jgi:hypothetical protein